jgi:hypothetical protein
MGAETEQAKTGVARAIKRMQEARHLLQAAAQALEVSYWDEAKEIEIHVGTLDREINHTTGVLGRVMAEELVYEQ